MLASLALLGATDFTAGLELRLYDLANASSSRQPSDRIAIIAMDEQSIASLGPLPWPRTVHARLVDTLAAAHAQTLVFTSLFSEPQIDPGLGYIRQLREALDSEAGQALEPGARLHMAGILEQAQTALDNDGALQASLHRAGNVLLPVQLAPATHPRLPIEALASAAAGLGNLENVADGAEQGVLRSQTMLFSHGGRSLPALALLAAMHSLNLGPGDLHLRAGDALQNATLRAGRLSVPLDGTRRLWPQFYPRPGAGAAFSVDSFDAVLSGKVDAHKFAGKIVIIGATAEGAGITQAVPGYAALSSTEAMAHVISSLLNAHFYVLPAWGPAAVAMAFLLVLAYLLAALPRLSTPQALVSTLGLSALLLGLECALLWGAAVWLKLLLPTAVLLLGHLALAGRKQLAAGAPTQGPMPQSACAMGLALQAQGQLDLAFASFRRAPLDVALLDSLYRLAQDFEGQNQFTQAMAVYRHMAAFNPDYRDILARMARPRGPADAPTGTQARTGTGAPARGLALQAGSLGRYQLEKELGRGAMGVVYLGRDPTIGRVVAIKTLELEQEYAAEDLADARARFLREAETAGRLQHPHIVTIFDAGEQDGLVYIAMEFLQGQDLTRHCNAAGLLPSATVLDIVARVALALAYAHQHHVVHRDIKPANVMYDAAGDTVKVTDFGIARITDASRTRTGLVLGTPSFMSPEQLAGKKVDGRSDLYSLGVMLYQLLTGVLPFRGASMSELMFKIANEEAADIRSLRPELPQALAQVVARALAKRPDARYQSGEQLAADLRMVQPVAADIEI